MLSEFVSGRVYACPVCDLWVTVAKGFCWFEKVQISPLTKKLWISKCPRPIDTFHGPVNSLDVKLPLHSCVPFYEPDVRNVAVSRKATKQWMLFFLKPQPLALFVGLGPRAHLKLANKDRVRIGTHQVWGLEIAIKNFWGMPWRYDVVDWCHDLRWIVWNGIQLPSFWKWHSLMQLCPCQMFFTFPVADDEIWADHCSLHAVIMKSSKSYRQLVWVFGKQIFTMLYRVVSSHVVSFHIMLFYFMVYHISYGISHHRRAGAYH